MTETQNDRISKCCKPALNTYALRRTVWSIQGGVDGARHTVPFGQELAPGSCRAGSQSAAGGGRRPTPLQVAGDGVAQCHARRVAEALDV